MSAKSNRYNQPIILKQFYLLLLCLYISMYGIAQNNVISFDWEQQINVLKRLSNQQSDSLKLRLPDFLAKAEATKNNCALAWGYYFKSQIGTSEKVFLKKSLAEISHCAVHQQIDLYALLGSSFNYNGDNTSALHCYTQIDRLSTDPTDLYSSGINKANVFLDRNNYEEASVILRETKQYLSKISVKNRDHYFSLKGYIYLNQNQLDSAKHYYTEALRLAQINQDQRSIITTQQNIGIIDQSLGNFTVAETVFLKNLTLSRDIADQRNQMYAYYDLGMLYFDMKRYDRSLSMAKKQLHLAEELNSVFYQKQSAALLQKIYAEKKDFKTSMSYLKKYHLFNDSLVNIDNTRKITALNVSRAFADKQMRDSISIMKTNAALAVEKGRRKSLSWIALLIALGAVTTGVLLWKNRKEKKRSQDLLLNILPPNIAEELTQQGVAISRKYEHVSILFLDISNFTQISAHLSPEHLVELLNTCFGGFDDIIQKYDLEKIKTIGDAYLAIDHIGNKQKRPDLMVQAAIEMMDFVQQLDSPILRQKGLSDLQVRIGIHTGTVIAGVVGKSKFQFDIWGDAVNIASRMESNSLPGKINISKTTYDLVKNSSIFSFEPRAAVEVKHCGMMEMYFLK